MEVSKLDASLVVWLVLFLLGGGLLALYYAGLGYFPEVTWQDALNYIALMTMIGGSLLVAYAFLLFVPGAIWSRYLIFDETLEKKKVLLMAGRDQVPCVKLITKRLVFPFALYMVFCHCLLYLLQDGQPAGLVPWGAAVSLAAISGLLGKILLEAIRQTSEQGDGKVQEKQDKPGPEPQPNKKVWLKKKLQQIKRLPRQLATPLPWLCLLVVASHVPLLAATIFKAVTCYSPDRWLLWVEAFLPLASFAGLIPLRGAERAERVQDQGGLLCRVILAFGSSALVSLAALGFFYRVYRNEGGGAISSSLLVICTLVVIVSNLAVSVLFNDERYPALLASFLAALLLLVAGQVLPPAKQALPARIMARFGFGEQDVTLVLTEKGGQILRAHGVEPTPAVPQQLSPTPAFVCIDKATLLSRLGSEYLLRVKVGGQWKKVTVPEAEVVSWSISEKPDGKLPTGNAAPRSPAPL